MSKEKVRSLRIGTINEIKANKDLALYSDVKQKYEMKCPNDFYEKCCAYIRANKRIFDDKDYSIIKMRYGNSKSTTYISKNIGFSEPSVCYRIRSILIKLKRNIKRISESSIYENEQPIEKTNDKKGFEKGFWKGEKISEMHYNHLVNALEYATQTKQHDKVKELTVEIEKRNNYQDSRKEAPVLEMVKAYARLTADIKRKEEDLEILKNSRKDFERYFDLLDRVKGE